ncbi:MAG: dipeptidase [Planctomycetota bacterium]|nr:dipeptidase [Planctomycetota bacterium]
MEETQLQKEKEDPPKPTSKRKLLGKSLLGVFLLILLAIPLIPRLYDRISNDSISRGPYLISEEARALHRSLFVADLHSDALLWNRNLLERNSYGHVDIPRLIEGGVALQGFTIVTKSPTASGYVGHDNPVDVMIRGLVMTSFWPIRTWNSLLERALYQCERLHEAERDSGGTFRVILAKEDLTSYIKEKLVDRKQVAGYLGIEGAHCLEGKIENIDRLFREGVRMMAPTHFFDTELGGSAHGKSQKGLTDFGKECIQRMEELGILLDLSHASRKMIEESLEIATKPVVFSHTGVRGAFDSDRNIDDQFLEKIRENGGVIGIGFWKEAVGAADVASIVKSIRYVATRAGVDHVGLGSDFDGSVITPFDSSGMGLLTEGLLEDGFTRDEIEKIMGRNVLRVLLQSLPSKETVSE